MLRLYTKRIQLTCTTCKREFPEKPPKDPIRGCFVCYECIEHFLENLYPEIAAFVQDATKGSS